MTVFLNQLLKFSFMCVRMSWSLYRLLWAELQHLGTTFNPFTCNCCNSSARAVHLAATGTHKTCTQITHSCKTKAKQTLQLFTAWMQSLPNSREWKNCRRATFPMEQRVQAADIQKKSISLVPSFHFFPRKKGFMVCRTVAVADRTSWGGAAQGAKLIIGAEQPTWNSPAQHPEVSS